MEKDIRQNVLYREAEGLYQSLRQPGTGQISDAAEIHASPNGREVVFAGAIVDVLEGVPKTRICHVDLMSGNTRVLTFGPNTDRLPKFSPNGRQVGFLSDRHNMGDFQLYLLDPISGAARPTQRVNGWVEYLHWSPDGARILLGVAGHGADLSGGQGAVSSKQLDHAVPSWMPAVEMGDESFRWRRIFLYDIVAQQVCEVICNNVWEAAWCGNEGIVAVASDHPQEGLWYTASLHFIEIHTGHRRCVYVPEHQLGCPTASPSGKQLAVVEGICSDRSIVAGDLKIIEVTSGKLQHVDTRGIDITYIEWRSDRHLLLAGHRGFETVVGLFDVTLERFDEVWSSQEVTTGGFYVSIAGLNELGDCVLVGESFLRAPEIGMIRGGEYNVVKCLDLGYSEQVQIIESVERVSWFAPDGLEIQAWLLLPKSSCPCPLVMFIHGGPVWHWRPMWLGRRAAHVLMLLKRGYAVIFPNPRGSSGRGRAFAERVVGDMGGADTFDYLSGLDHLVKQGVADSKRLGVTGVSYGGFMTSWLITQDSRFAAAVAVAPHTNQVTEHLLSNIPHFMTIFLGDQITNPTGKYFQRSPIMQAHKVRTPTLNICGALDRCTPPEEAVQFHRALLENGAKSALVIYPEEGHGVRNFPAAIDYAARVVGWFEEHMPTPSD